MYVCLAICSVKHSWSQTKNIRHEVVIQNDNDVYLLTSQDRYYTNGININYRLGLRSDTSRLKNRVLDIEFGQKMYNGINLYTTKSLQWDRPFAGYLYLSGELNQFYNDDQVLSLKVELGQVGPLAKGKEVQQVIHQVFKMYEVSGWDQEISNAFGVDLGVKYQKLIYRSINNNFEISGVGSTTLGMNHINAHIGLPIRWEAYAHSVIRFLQRGMCKAGETIANYFYTTYLLFILMVIMPLFKVGWGIKTSTKDNIRLKKSSIAIKSVLCSQTVDHL